MIQQLLGAGLGKTIDDVLSRFFEDKDQATRAAKDIRMALLEHEQTAQQVARDVIVAEAESEHWITSTWRPLLMLVFVAIVANNYLIAPYVDMIFGSGLQLEPPPVMWEVIKVGLGGYVVGRSGEKIMREYKKKPSD